MKLREVFDHLTHGELSQLAIVDSSAKQIPESKYPAVVSHINLGLTDLFKRFNLKEGRTEVTLVPGTILYPLAAADLIKVEKVLTDDEVEIPLNKAGINPYSITTPTLKTLLVPSSITDQVADLPEVYKTSKLEVVYRAKHELLVCTADVDIDPDTVELELPYTHLQALLLFVASRVHNPIGMTGEFNAGNNYAAKYEAEVQSLKNDGVQLETAQGYDNFHAKGWC